MNHVDIRKFVTGAGGGGKGGKGGGSGGGGTEAPNTLKSKQVAKVIDVLSEGPIVGLVNDAQSVFFDGVRAQNPDGTYNFRDATVTFQPGYPDQPIINGYASQQSEISVNGKITTTSPIVRNVNNPDVDRVRVTVSVPALQKTNRDSGDTKGTSVKFEVFIESSGGGGYRTMGVQTISGKTNTKYQRALVYTMDGPGPWNIRIVRLTADSTDLALQNDLYWDSYTAIIDAKVNYNSSAVMATTINSEQFQSIPNRVYLVDGREIQIPSNYDPYTRVYTGTWDGTFQIGWTNNPAWVYYDLITHTRYGLGNYVTPAMVDKWSLYRIARFCDENVDNGKGGLEPRFTCNVWITEGQEAFNLLGSIASIFRGFSFWSAGMMVACADMPTDPVGQYTNATVVDGLFTYSGADIKARHNMAYVAWKDPANLGEPRIAIAEDQEDISINGIQPTQVTAFGCTSEAQALRVGRWTLFSELYEAEIVTFQVGPSGAWSRPGDIIEIADRTVSGRRRGGRIVAATTHVVTVDSPFTLEPGETDAVLSVYVTDGSVATLPILDISADGLDITVIGDYSSAPTPGSAWVVSSGTLDIVTWRVMNVKEMTRGVFEINAIRHRPDKWDYVERNMILSNPTTSLLNQIDPVTNLNAQDYIVMLSPTSVGVSMLISWTSTSPQYEVIYWPDDGNATTVMTANTALEVPVLEGFYTMQVTPINSIGIKGQPVSIRYEVVGRTAPPADPLNFRIQVLNDIGLFQWAPTTDLDVIVGGSFEMRYSPLTGAGVTWASSNPVLLSIPGTAVSVELPYRPGTYLLRAKDILGNYSVNAAAVTTFAVDSDAAEFFRICESPNWLGNKSNTVIKSPEDWLILGTTGGLWDAQLDDMDTWPDVDILATDVAPPTSGVLVGGYDFFNRIDLGGVYATTLNVEMFAFPFSESSTFIDDRTDNVDTWQSWDDITEDLKGYVQIQVRQTDGDPSLSPTWSPWKQFVSGEYQGRGFEFRAILTAPVGQNVAIEELCVTADLRNKSDHGSDIPWTYVTGSTMTILFNAKFYQPPAISIQIQTGNPGDYAEISAKTREQFVLALFDGNTNLPIPSGTRTFDWIATGY
jgi:hypothetical protein